MGNRLKRVFGGSVVAAAFVLGWFSYADAEVMDIEGFGAGVGVSDLAASAHFDFDGSVLTVTLTNISTDMVLVPADVLSGVYFDWEGATLAAISATLPMGSEVIYPDPAPGYDGSERSVAGEWAFRSDLMSGFGGAQFGVSSSGMDNTFGGPDLIDDANLFGNTVPNGSDYGIVSIAGIGMIDNDGPLDGEIPYIMSSVKFVFAVTGEGLSVNDIVNVSFQYGTSEDEPNIPGIVPEPATAVLMGLGIVGILLRRISQAGV